IYHPPDTKCDSRTDTKIGELIVPALGPGISDAPIAFTFTIPSGTAPGTYYLIAVADAERDVVESNEENNITTQLISVTSPDLIVSVSATPSAAAAGTSITVTETTKNQGTALATASTTRMYLDATNTPQIARPVVPALAA